MGMIVGVDPHKRSVTLEVVDEDGTVAATGRFGTGNRDYRAMLAYVRRQWPQHRWAVECGTSRNSLGLASRNSPWGPVLRLVGGGLLVAG